MSVAAHIENARDSLTRAVIELLKNSQHKAAQDVIGHIAQLEAFLASPVASIEDGLSHTERGLIRDGKFIEAIKDCRSRTGLGLKEAKDLCDAYREKL